MEGEWSCDNYEARMVGVDKTALFNGLQFLKWFSDDVTNNSFMLYGIAWSICFVDNFIEVVSTVDEEIDSETAIGFFRVNRWSISKSGTDESVIILSIDSNNLCDSEHGVEAKGACLYDCKHLQ